MMTPLFDSFNQSLDQLVRPRVYIHHRSWSAFQVCGGTGLVLAIGLMLTLAALSGLSVPVMAGLVVADLLACLTLAMITKIILGEERLTYCHHEIAIILVTVALSWVLDQPILSYIDVSILGLGLGLVCGRVGCLMAGCCHGRPSRWGVCYGAEHVAAGFSPYYAGTRFFPVQIVESMWVGGIVIIGCLLVVGGYPAGMATALYICAYGAGRFFLEFVRADTDRAYLGGFSESQWLSLVLMSAVTLGEFLGILPFQWWHVAATALVSLTMLAVAVRRQLQSDTSYQLLLPRHIDEIAQALDSISNHADNNGAGPRHRSRRPGIPIDCTSLGVQISAGRIKVAGSYLDHYALSHQTANMTQASAKALARLILQLRHPSGRSNLIAGNRGVFHLLVAP
jgi:hypothetical protein